MSVSLLKAIASDRASLVLSQWPVRFGLSNPPARLVQLTGRIATPLGPDSLCNARWLSGSTTGAGDLIGRGFRRKEVFSEEIDDLNAEIAGFVGDLGDPDFDAPPGESMRGTQTKRHNRSAQTSIPRPAGGTPATQQDTQGNDTKQPHRRLTLADDPFAIDSTPGADSGALKETTGEPAWKSSLMTGRPQDDNTAAKSVLVLNGAACFIAGKLASTGEPRGVVTQSMENAATELDLSLTVCTSNRKDELLDHLCEGSYDAIVYNPSGFGSRGSGMAVTTTTTPVHQTNDECSTATDSDVAARPEPDRNTPRRQQLMRDSFLRQNGGGCAIEYGLSRARCPVVIISPGDDCYTGLGMHGPIGRPGTGMGPSFGGHIQGRSGEAGTIAGFSGAVSYRLAMMAVASMVDEI